MPCTVTLQQQQNQVVSALCLGPPEWAGTRKVKPIWVYWSKRQSVAVASAEPYANQTSRQTDNHASTPPLSFLQAGCSSCHPTNSIKALYMWYKLQRTQPKPFTSFHCKMLIGK